ncbi:DUF411 domain-containing protein [Devosia albogilva]|uniref:DUF411 domain-containing protein n=1 Tax=Devosia albogilva TaxID=429726 RepID=A0ABW5QNF3_9HYPH
MSRCRYLGPSQQCPPPCRCGTGEMAGYVLEGHDPAMAARRLLHLRPTVRGLAVPGMPLVAERRG